MTTVILLAHGSPDARSGEATRALAAALQGRSSGTTVQAAFLQHDEPTLTQVAAALARDGVDSAVVVPAFLSNAFHARVDVPQAVAEAEASSGLRLAIADPIGTDAALLAALDRGLPEGPVVLATAGTSDVDAQLAFDRLAAGWADRRGAPVAVAYASQAAPDVSTAVARLEEETGRQAAIGSFVLFPGVLPDRIAAAAAGRVVTGPLFTEIETIDVIESRVRCVPLIPPRV